MITRTNSLAYEWKPATSAALLLIFFLSVRPAFPQTVHIQQADSLRQELVHARQDTTRAIILAELAEAYRAERPDSTLYYADQALRLSRSIDFPFGEMRAYFVLCHYFQFNGIDLPKALETGLKAVDITRKYHFKDYEAGCLIRLGTVYLTLGNTQEALNCFRRGNQLSANGVHPFFHAITYTWLANTYLSMNKPDSAFYVATLGYEQAIATKNDFVIGGALGTLGRMYALKGNYALAKHYYYRRIAVAERIEEYVDVAKGYMSLANLFRDLKQNDSAIYCAKKAYELYRPRLFASVYDPAKLLSTLLEASDPTEALHYLKIAFAARDSAYNTQQIQSAQALAFKEKERQTELSYEKKAYETRVRQYGLVAGIGFLILALIGLYRNNRNKQTANLLLEKQKAKVEETLAELKSTQSQLIQSEKMASLGELTAGIAHEIQNPLNFVNNFSEVNSELAGELTQAAAKGDLLEVQSIAVSIKENEEKINHHGKRADAIVKGMLQHSRKGTGQKEFTDINALCDEYLRLAYHGLRAKDKSFNAKFETNLDPTLPKINVVPQEIGRVVLNLINNAFFAVSERQKAEGQKPNSNYEPTVIVSTSRVGAPLGLPAGTSAKAGVGGAGGDSTKIEIRVSDNGPGIPNHIKGKIFQPFFTTKPTGQGTGLGLSISYDLVKAHGGDLRVESEENKGTSFFISLPA